MFVGRSLIIYVDKDITDYFVEVIINKKSLASMILTRLFCSGGGTRTHDLRIMNPTL